MNVVSKSPVTVGEVSRTRAPRVLVDEPLDDRSVSSRCSTWRTPRRAAAAGRQQRAEGQGDDAQGSSGDGRTSRVAATPHQGRWRRRVIRPPTHRGAATSPRGARPRRPTGTPLRPGPGRAPSSTAGPVPRAGRRPGRRSRPATSRCRPASSSTCRRTRAPISPGRSGTGHVGRHQGDPAVGREGVVGHPQMTFPLRRPATPAAWPPDGRRAPRRRSPPRRRRPRRTPSGYRCRGCPAPASPRRRRRAARGCAASRPLCTVTASRSPPNA